MKRPLGVSWSGLAARLLVKFVATDKHHGENRGKQDDVSYRCKDQPFLYGILPRQTGEKIDKGRDD